MCQLPIIQTERLLLRTYVRDDMEDLFLIVSDPDVRRYFADRNPTREELWARSSARMKFWRTNGFGQFGVFEKEPEKLVGYCGLKPLDGADDIEIYYGYARDGWGKGYATEAAKAVLRFGFEVVGLERIVAVTHTENIASQKVIQKIGLQWKRNDVFYDLPVKYFSLNKTDYAGGADYVLGWREVDDEQ